MTHLLDVNVLIALLDADHQFHERASTWFAQAGRTSWATSPIVQNGVVRIMGGSGYTNLSLGCDGVAGVLREWCRLPQHQFWADDVSILDDALVKRAGLRSPTAVTDTYLLALAVRHGGKLATFDRRLSTAAVHGGVDALCVID